MVGVNLTVGRPVKNGKKGFCVQVIEPGGKTRKTPIRYRYRTHKMYTYIIKTDALAVEIEASTIDAAAVTFGRSAGLSGDNCQEILESVSGIVGAWMWIESDDAPDGGRRGGSSPRYYRNTSPRSLRGKRLRIHRV
jgi:hypothetical protein